MIMHLSAPIGQSINDHISKEQYSLQYASVDDELLGIFWRNAFYTDTCLPLGLQSAPFLFSQYAEALQWILKNNYGLNWLIHYLDDYFIAGPPHSCFCQKHLNCFLKVCEQLGIPVDMDKMEGPFTVLIFLGLELNFVLQLIQLPQSKLEQLQQELQLWKECKKTTKHKLLPLIGKLAFAARAVPAGRLFTMCLIAFSSKVTKFHHCIKLKQGNTR